MFFRKSTFYVNTIVCFVRIRNMYEIVLLVLSKTVFGIFLRTFDCYGDLTFAFKAFESHNYLICCLIITPVLANLLFTTMVWMTSTFDSRREKWWSWILLPLSLWPQYQIAKLLKSIASKTSKEEWKKHENKLDKELLFIEPWLESIPQMFSSVCVYSLLRYRDIRL